MKSSRFSIIVGVIILIVVGTGSYFINNASENKSTTEEVRESPPPKESKPSLTGQKLSDTNFASSATEIYPGTLDASAKAAISGWNLKTTKLSDGTIRASLVPVGSEATEGDAAHTFNLNTGDKLYFVDLNTSDDQPGQDNIKGDDMGIVVDANGIIQ